jgi:hypothetical protein
MENIKNKIKSILPENTPETTRKLKQESPYGILLEFSEAVNEKYNNLITARVTESIKVSPTQNDSEKQNPVFAFYLQAPIGKGYLYRLLEVEQLTNGLYPVSVKIFQNRTVSLENNKRSKARGRFESYDEFYSALLNFFQTSFVSNLILNLIGQVELYNESRQE